MASQSEYPTDPMTAFYAAVTAIENGSIGEIELHFEKHTPDYETSIHITVRKEAMVYNAIPLSSQKED